MVLAIAMPGSDNGGRVTFLGAIEKLGLKLEQKALPQKVLVVDSVNRKPTANSPEVAKALPAVEVPKEFDVADVKLSNPDVRTIRIQPQPGGRFVAEGAPIKLLVSLAVGTAQGINVNEQAVGWPGFADTLRLDITAKAPADAMTLPGIDMQVLWPMIMSLLKERLKFAYHIEDRPVTAYKLVAAKPKMKKADPESRIFCKFENPPGGATANRTLQCQNASMALLAERLRGMAPGLSFAISDETGLEGGWDFTFTFNQLAGLAIAPPRRAPDGGGGRGGDLPAAADPSGAYTVFEAIEKQLGLKLESVKKPMPVLVVDHLEPKVLDN
jgi:uncharacterized protein (TIGR03435 family)